MDSPVIHVLVNFNDEPVILVLIIKWSVNF